ncbi:MAG: hypothetical protein Q8Q18_01535 [bacterium]|nr:hypothetical protein [bacterium]
MSNLRNPRSIGYLVYIIIITGLAPLYQLKLWKLMNYYIISYRLHQVGKNYEQLYTAIRSLTGTYWHNTTSSWIVNSSLSAKKIFEHLNPFIDNNDELVVFKLEGSYYGQLNPDDLKWLDKQSGLYVSI